MCTNCLRHGWRGIKERGAAFIELLDSTNVWARSKKGDSEEIHSPGGPAGADLKRRLERLWKFIRLELAQHFKFLSGVGAHCLNLRLGSLADDRLNSPCKHRRADGRTVEAPALYTESDSICHHDHTGGDTESQVQSQYIRTVRTGMGLPVGTKVSANFHTRGTYYTGEIVGVGERTYDILYDDGVEEKNVDPRLVRVDDDMETEDGLHVGSHVEVRYARRKLWYLVVITRTNDDSTYEIRYDSDNCKSETETASGGLANKLHTCRYCNVSYCHDHLSTYIATGETPYYTP